MTATVDSPTSTGPPVSSRESTAGEGDVAASGRRVRPKTLIAWAVTALIVLFLAVVIVEDPIAHVWYQARQGRLASEGGSTHAIAVGRQVGVLFIQYPVGPSGVASTQKLYVVQGDGTNQLRGGPGHQPQTPMPGHKGNVVIFGHRLDWGAPFSKLSTLVKGAQIQAQSVDGTQPVVYTVTQTTTIAASKAASLLAASDDYRLTLVTDAGGRTSHRWLVVTAVSGPLKAGPGASDAVAGPSPRSPFANGAFLGLVLAIIAGGVVVVGLRRRAGFVTLCVLLAPVVATGLLAFALEFDLVWSPLA